MIDLIKTTGAVLAALGVIFTGLGQVDLRPAFTRDISLYAAAVKTEMAELRQMAGDATRLAMAAKFQILYDKHLKCACLSFFEIQEMCRLARELDYTGIQGCGA